MAHNHVAGGEVGVVAPRAVELGGVAGRVHIEVGHPLELALAHVVEVEDLEAGPVVGLVDQALMGVHVVVDGRRGAHVGADQADVVQVLYVEDVGARVDRALIELVADQQVFVVLGQPALVGVGRRGVARGAEQHRVSGIGHVHDGHGILVETEGNLLSRVLRIGPDVVHDLGVVAVAVLGEAADEGGGERVADVDDVQPAGEGVGPDGVGPAGLLVDGDVVAVAEAAIVRVGGEGDGGIGDIAQLGQVKHLHAVGRRFGDDEGVVGVDLDVAPERRHCMGRKITEIDRIVRVGHIDEGGARGASEQGVFLTVERVGPAPDVVHLAAADFAGHQVAHEVDLIAGVDAGKAVHTGRGRDVVGRVTDAVAIRIGGAIAVAHAEGVHLADAVVHIVADSVAIGVGRAVATAHAEGVQLGAVAVAIPGRNVIAATLVDGPGSAADAAGIQLGTGAVIGVGIGVVVAGRRVRTARNGGRLHTEVGHV